MLRQLKTCVFAILIAATVHCASQGAAYQPFFAPPGLVVGSNNLKTQPLLPGNESLDPLQFFDSGPNLYGERDPSAWELRPRFGGERRVRGLG